MSQQGRLTTAGSGGSVVETLTGNSGGAVGPDASFNINILGNNTSGINVVGMPGTNTVTIVGIQATTTQRGTVELATDAEAIAGTDAVNALTSSNLTAKLGAQTLHGLPIGAGNAAAITWTAAPTDGQILIGDTGSDPVLGNLTSTGGTISITNGAGTINLETVAGTGIETIGGDTGSITGASVTIFAANASQNCGSSVKFVNSGTTSTLNVSDALKNTIIGVGSGNATITGLNNVGLGFNTCTNLTSGINNIGVGVSASSSITTGNSNTGVGPQALDQLVTGSNNVAIGVDAGFSYNGAESSNITIGHFGTAGDNNIIRIGVQGAGAKQQNQCFIAGITGVTVSNPAFVTLNTSTGQLGTSTGLPGIVTWTAIGANQTLAVGNGYFCTTGGALSLALPGTSAVGDIIRVVLDGSTSWTITQPNAATRIRIGSSQTTLGVTGTLASTSVGDSIELVCETANARWAVTSMIGNITVV